MRDLMAELKELRLHGMASAWEELASQGEASTASSKWLLEHLLQQEHADRAVRSVNHQMNMAKLPMHRDLAGFDFSASSADARLIRDLSNLEFTDTAQNVVFIGGPGTGKTHLATALAVSGITTHHKRVRFYSTVDLVNLLEREKYDGKTGRISVNLAVVRCDIGLSESARVVENRPPDYAEYFCTAMFHNVVRRCTAVSSWSVNQLFYSVPIGSIRHFIHVEELKIINESFGR